MNLMITPVDTTYTTEELLRKLFAAARDLVDPTNPSATAFQGLLNNPPGSGDLGALKNCLNELRIIAWPKKPWDQQSGKPLQVKDGLRYIRYHILHRFEQVGLRLEAVASQTKSTSMLHRILPAETQLFFNLAELIRPALAVYPQPPELANRLSFCLERWLTYPALRSVVIMEAKLALQARSPGHVLSEADSKNAAAELLKCEPLK